MASFRFFGHNAGDWFGGSRDEKHYAVLFRKAPDAKLRRAIVDCFLERLATGQAAPAPVSGSGWQWCGRWARTMIVEREDADRGWLADVSEAFDAIHALAPLEEVIFEDRREDDPEGPPPQKPPEKGWTFDKALEKHVEAARAAALPPPAKEIKGERGPSLVKVDAKAVPKEPKAGKVPKAFGEHAKHKYDSVLESRSKRPVVRHFDGERSSACIVFLDDGGEARESERGWLGFAEVAPDGSCAVTSHGSGTGSLYRVDLPSGKETQLFTDSKVKGLCWVGERHVAVLTTLSLYLLDPQDPESLPLGKLETGGLVSPDSLRGARDGRLLLVRGDENLLVVGAAAETLAVLANLKVEAEDCFERDGRIYVETKRAAYELVGADDALARLAETAPKPAARKRAPAAAVALSKASAKDAAWLSAAREGDVDEATQKRFPAGFDRFFASAPSGVVLGWKYPKGDFAWIHKSGEVRTLGIKFEMACTSVSPDGAELLLGARGSLRRVDLATGKTDMLAFTPDFAKDQPGIYAAERGPDGRVVVQTFFGRVLLLDSGGKVLAEETGQFGSGLVTAMGGRIAVAAWKGRLSLYAIRGDALAPLQSLPLSVMSLMTSPEGDRVFALEADREEWHEITGLAGA